MAFFHHNLRVELNDDWWTEADMAGFVPKSKSYRVSNDKPIFEVSIEEIDPVCRVHIFKDDEEQIKDSRCPLAAVTLTIIPYISVLLKL